MPNNKDLNRWPPPRAPPTHSPAKVTKRDLVSWDNWTCSAITHTLFLPEAHGFFFFVVVLFLFFVFLFFVFCFCCLSATPNLLLQGVPHSDYFSVPTWPAWVFCLSGSTLYYFSLPVP